LEMAQNELTETHSKLQSQMSNLAKNIDRERQTLNMNQTAFKNYAKEVKKKLEVLATRDRMLQLSQERNVYSKKIIYVLYSIIITLIISIIAAYTYFSKKITA
jgi:hypothetical protein